MSSSAIPCFRAHEWSPTRPARTADLLEVVTIVRDDGSELAIQR